MGFSSRRAAIVSVGIVLLLVLVLAVTTTHGAAISSHRQGREEGHDADRNPNPRENTGAAADGIGRAYALQSAAGAEAEAVALTEFRSLPVARLRRFLGERGAACDGCREKRDLVTRAVEVMNWPTTADSMAAELSLEQDLMGPLATYVGAPVGGDIGELLDVPSIDESITQSPSARPSLQPLSDAEVQALLQLYAIRLMVGEGLARCGPRFLNGTQHCGATFVTVTSEQS